MFSCLCSGGNNDGGEVSIMLCEWRTLTPCTRGIISRTVHVVRYPRGSYMVSRGSYMECSHLLSPEVATLQNKINKIRSWHPKTQESVHKVRGSPPHKWFFVGCSSPFMRLNEQLTALALGARDLCPWLGENPTCFAPA